MTNLFISVFHFFKRRKALMFLLLSGMAALLVLSARRMSFVEDIASFMPNSADNHRIEEAYQKIGAANTIIVTIGANAQHADKETLTAAATRFAQVLLANDSDAHIKKLVCEVDNQKINDAATFIMRNLPLFMEAKDYAHIDSIIAPQSISAQLRADKEILTSPMGGFLRSMILNDPLHFAGNALQDLHVFEADDNYEYDAHNGFIFNKQGECIVSIASNYPVSESAKNKLLANEIYHAAQQTQSEFEHAVSIVPFGAALLSITNAEQIKSDSMFAAAAALVLILALLFYFFGSMLPLCYIAVSVLFGALFSLGVIAMLTQNVSIIAIGIASIILGIAINYPLHFLAHRRHARSTEQTLRQIVSPLLIGNITTVGAFLSLLFLSSPAMRDLGLFASLLLVGTIVFVLLFLPQFTIRTTNFHAPSIKKNSGSSMIFTRLSNFSPERNKYLVVASLVLTLVLLYFSFGTKFESNLHSINYMTNEQRVQMDKLLQQNDDNAPAQYMATQGTTIEQALQNYESMLPAISEHDVSGIGRFFPSKAMQQRKIEQWNNFWQNRKEVFLSNFAEQASKQGFREQAFDGFIAAMQQEFVPQDFSAFAPLYDDLGENYFLVENDKSIVYTILRGAPLSINNEHSFTFDNGSIVEKMVDTLSADFNNVLYICGMIVFLFLLFSFGRIELALLTFVPLTLGWVWILGLMNILDLKFNIVNIIVATFIFGQGDDYTIFITEGMIYEHAYRRKMLASFKKSILLSAAILFIAIGMLIFAKHPAMRSLASLTMVGMVSVVVCAYLFPPLLFRFLTTKNGKPRQVPWTLKRFAMTAYAFAVFLAGSVVARIYALILFGGRKQHSVRNKLRFHALLHGFANFVIRRVPATTFRFDNLGGETFHKPAIIISNHQSHLDIMCLMMLTPKLIIVTNEWVWRSPFYGRIIRYADFAPIAHGIENSMPRLAAAVQSGYSIVIFPEGTRSEDCSIGRFHKGAFYAAQQLGLDIVPVMLHGIGHIQPKHDFLLRQGQITIQVHARQHIDQHTDCREYAKNMRQWYTQQFAALRGQIETPQYYKHMVLYNYMYKGKSVWQAACKEYQVFSKEYKENSNEYETTTAQPLAPMPNTKILVKNNGYGVKGMLVAHTQPHAEVIATEDDEHKTAIAQNCAGIPPNLHIYTTEQWKNISSS